MFRKWFYSRQLMSLLFNNIRYPIAWPTGLDKLLGVSLVQKVVYKHDIFSTFGLPGYRLCNERHHHSVGLVIFRGTIPVSHTHTHTHHTHFRASCVTPRLLRIGQTRRLYATVAVRFAKGRVPDVLTKHAVSTRPSVS